MIIVKAMIISSLANPNLSLISTALFHSTPFLSTRKNSHHARSHSRGAPRHEFKAVFKRPQQFQRIIDNYEYQTLFEQGAAQNSSNSSKSSSSNSSKSSSNSSEKPLPRETMSSSRLALGLSATGPVTLEQVKIAYRQRAMKWHPDHHQGIDKAFAEEHFKRINAAHESLCNELSTTSTS